ncbi:response regulator transcription factor [Acidovorax sp. DW039]|uniref:response regulator transcription factor n=1 Tax=Acidovorax sp. DW039 TaxID=3095606 RepID=UPI00308EE61A|nr:response regulator transcription factor [Acidovorax sp. DW039]
MRVLLIEDDDVIARELRLRWTRPGWSVQVCGSLREAQEALGQGSFNLIVLDLGLPDGDGLEWLSKFRRHDKLTPVLVLTARDRISDRVHGLQSGADDYLVKPFSVEELDARLEVLARRSQLARGELMHYGSLSWLGDEGCAYADGKRLDLLPREFEVLGMLIRRAPRLLPKQALIEALARRNTEVGDSTAEVYISRLRRKLAGSGTMIRTLRGFGYVLELEPVGAPDPEGPTE